MANQGNLAQHPQYYGVKITDQMRKEMKIPSDTRALRDIKIGEFPQWFMKRDFSPMGMWYAARRYRYKLMSKYIHVTRPGLNIFLMGFITYGLACHFTSYKDLKLEARRKYH